MADRDIYLKIEPIFDYSPVEPEPKVAPPKQYRRDCMRNMGHEDTTIPLSEVNARRLTALVYREYLDSTYLVPKPDKLVLADINEPVFSHRVPGTVIYACPGERLLIHVLNADVRPHSFHVHGLKYGISSDGSWPFGTQSTDGRRSDEICTGQTWTYLFDVTNESLGAWAFHDHCRNIGANVNRGLFGGIIVLPVDEHYKLPKTEVPRVAHGLLGKVKQVGPPIVLWSGPGTGHGGLGAGHGGHGQGAGGPGHGGMPGAGHVGHGTTTASNAAMGGMGGVFAASQHGHGGEHEHERPVNFGQLVDEGRRVGALLDEWAGLDYTHPRPKRDEPLNVPLFYHVMQGVGGTPAFDSGPISPGGSFSTTFGAEGVFSYHCQFHPMQGTVNVVMGAPSLAVVTIENTPDVRFNPPVVPVAPGGQVRWDYPGLPVPGAMVHTVTEDAGGMPSFCFNGRSFVGNTPTIVAEAGQRIRWYVFDLDLSMAWHNFHPHASRWQFADQMTDVRSIGPAESFWVETIAPPVLLLPPDIEKTQPPRRRPKNAKEYRLRGDFLVHCHVEMHMMGGMVGLVRSLQTVWLTDAQAHELAATTGLPIDDMQNTCPDVDAERCALAGCGRWENVPDLPGVTMMHAALIPDTNKVMFFGYGDTRTDLSRIWDYTGPGVYSLPPNQPANVESVPGDMVLQNIWSAEHAYDANGVLLVHGGFTPRESYLFDPVSFQWSRTDPTADARFYSTTLTLADGRLLTLFGSNSVSIEVYDPAAGTWGAPIGLPFADYQFYPWTYLLPDGDLFIAGPEGISRQFDWTATPISGTSWPTNAGNRDTSKGQKGTSVLLPLRPPGYEPRVLIAGGDTVATQSSSEIIDLSAGAPAWSNLPNLNVPRPEQVNTVLLPDGRVFLAGGVDGAGGPAEIFDPQDPLAGWLPCASMTIPRGYHSSAILLVDGSVLMGGDRPGAWKSGETTSHERYYPSYCSGVRPSIGAAPGSVAHGSTFTVSTPDAASIGEVVLLRPGAVTHGFNMSQRFIGCQVLARNPGSVDVLAPPDGNVAPPGYYLLFLVDGGRIPSTARWIRLGP